MQRTLRACERVPADRLFHVRYLDTLNEPMSVVWKVYDFCGIELTSSAEEAIRRYDENNRQHQHGKHDYSLEEFGLSRDRIDAAYAEYLALHGDKVRR